MIPSIKSQEKYVDPKRVKIVYFTYLNKDRWRLIVPEQIRDLIKSGILSVTNHVYAVIVSEDESEVVEASNVVSELLLQANAKVSIITSYENKYEYLGIETLYKECKLDPDNIFLYFHSKGMVFHSENKRHDTELLLVQKMIYPWQKILNIFDANSNINKVCFGSAEGGFCWYNFFWVRGKYVAEKCKIPEISDDRYVYEEYIGKYCKDSSYQDCYSIVEDTISQYSSAEILSLTDSLLTRR